MKTLHFSLLLLLTVVAVAKGQNSTWEIKVDEEILHSAVSKDGIHALYIYEDDNDSINAVCIDAINGMMLWKRTLVDFDQYTVCRFINNDTVMLGQKQQYEFINAESGKLLKTLPIIGDDWDYLRIVPTREPKHDNIEPYFKEDVAIIYFHEGFQVLDLKKLEITYQTTESPSELKYHEWGSLLFLNFIGGTDSLYFLDRDKKQIVYKASLDDFPINSSVYQPFASSGSELLLFNEDNIQNVNLETGKLNATIEIDPDDPEAYIPVVLKSGLHLMVSDEGTQKLYRTKDGKMLWQTKEGVFPGLVEQIVEIPENDGQGIIFSYDEDGQMMLHRVDLNSGAVAWKKLLFIQDGRYDPGHKEGSKTMAIIGSIAVQLVLGNTVGKGSGWSRDPFSNRISYSRQDDYVMNYANSLYNSWVNKKKATEGYAAMLFVDKNQIVVSTAGLIWKPENKEQDEYDGEGVWTVNLADGSITKSQPCNFLAKADIPGLNAFSDLQLKDLDSIKTKVLIGVNDIYVAKQDKIDHFNFKEERLKFITKTTTDVAVIADNDGESYDYWRINAAASPAEQSLIARSTHKNIVFPNPDTTKSYVQNYLVYSGTTLNITDDDISAYDRKVGPVTPSTFSSPRWRVTSDELDNLGVGNYTEVHDFFNGIHGVFLFGDQVIIMGDDAIGTISKDGKCRWSHEWSPNWRTTRMGLLVNDYKAMYVTGDKVAILKNTCEGGVVAEHEIDASDIQILKAEENPTCVVIVDTDEGILRGYSLLK